MQPTDYLAELTSRGLEVRDTGVWAAVGRPDRDFGWKLHISSIQVEAPTVIARILPVLRAHDTPFKIARDARILGELNEGTFGATQIGKFATIYPASDTLALTLARALLPLLSGLSGPRIVTDLPLGETLYARFGQFDPAFTRDRLGNLAAGSAPAGAEYRVPFVAPDGIANPFAAWPAAGGSTSARSLAPAATTDASLASRLIGPGFLLLDSLSAHPKGSVFLAADMRSAEQCGLIVLKEGRRHCMSDPKGRDMWDRLTHQHALAAWLSDDVAIPRHHMVFDRDDSLFLAIDHVEGRDFSDRPARRYDRADIAHREQLIGDLIGLAATLGDLHRRGVVHRDLSPRNVRVGADGRTWLLDLEMAAPVGERDALFMQGTMGFISPEQQAGGAAAFADDLYAVGALIANAITGFDPRRMSLAADADLAGRLAMLSGAPSALVALAVDLLAADPADRPAIAEVEARLRRIDARTVAISSLADRADDALLDGALSWLVAGGLRDDRTGLPLSPELQALGHDASLSVPQAYRLFRSANRGVAGVLYGAARLVRLGARAAQVGDFAERAVDWLLAHAATPDDQMPGLHFGEAGVALAFVEAVDAGLIDRGRWFEAYLDQVFSGPLDWPDLTHGAAGQGLAALQAAYGARLPGLARYADQCARYLIDRQRADGSWAWPDGVSGMEGTVYTGFAHGVAGIVHFLAVHARARGDRDAMAAARAGGEWLVRQARRNGAHSWWPRAQDPDDAWHWWCHGGPGIALALLALYALDRDARWADLARDALGAHALSPCHPNLSQCHGLAGLGEIYLEAARVLDDPQWLARARRISATLIGLQRRDAHGISWMVENPHIPTADLMIGSAGVAHFLARLARADVLAVGMPLGVDLTADLNLKPQAMKGALACN
jgi:hypothetical protein